MRSKNNREILLKQSICGILVNLIWVHVLVFCVMDNFERKPPGGTVNAVEYNKLVTCLNNVANERYELDTKIIEAQHEIVRLIKQLTERNKNSK